jgi:hypothetical protein
MIEINPTARPSAAAILKKVRLHCQPEAAEGAGILETIGETIGLEHSRGETSLMVQASSAKSEHQAGTRDTTESSAASQISIQELATAAPQDEAELIAPPVLSASSDLVSAPIRVNPDLSLSTPADQKRDQKSAQKSLRTYSLNSVRQGTLDDEHVLDILVNSGSSLSCGG